MNFSPPRRSDGTIQNMRVPLPWPEDRPFRILSIDGGGICGILPASILAELESRFLGGSSIVNHFDMIAGTSTGGIIALGLAKGLTAAQIRDVYVERGGSIFPPTNLVGRAWRRVRRLQRYVYERQPLQNELLRIFGDTALDEARVRLCIPAFEGTYGEPWIYKTPHHPDYKRDRFAAMVTVGLATAAAPTFFSALPNNGYTMVDGGLWANNPIMNAVVDAMACFEINRRQIQVLSLGCGETSFKVDAAKSFGGLWQWRKGISAAMRAQSLNALGQAFLLVGKDQVIRLDAPESAMPIELDDYRRARAELPAMARSLVEASGHRIAASFFADRVITPVVWPFNYSPAMR
ncbi:MAG TPA: CBASS cGAMP-activated phospholipase [Methylosinus sp.]|jgi:predicted acylesterase/phospholipase RssA|uniref:CBASS cGAMP-activated phospholipase n=1 Tax=Methylosinus sp. TaxID=427 RepID=UPI002F92C4C1